VTALPPPGQYKVSKTTILVPELKGTGGKKEAIVYAPSTPGNYPFITFAHGIIDDNYVSLMSIVASYGYLVTNLQNCVPECNLKSYADDQVFARECSTVFARESVQRRSQYFPTESIHM
jgi:hypothetical protein